MLPSIWKPYGKAHLITVGVIHPIADQEADVEVHCRVFYYCPELAVLFRPFLVQRHERNSRAVVWRRVSVGGLDGHLSDYCLTSIRHGV